MCLFYPLYCDIMSLTSLKITSTFDLLLEFAENGIGILKFKRVTSICTIKDLDNGDLDNRSPTVPLKC